MRHCAELIFVVEYLREFEYICKTVLAHESWDPGVQVNEKTEGGKSCETVPLNTSANTSRTTRTIGSVIINRTTNSKQTNI
jgi:hypothetical protein